MWQRFRRKITQAAMCSSGLFVSCSNTDAPIFPSQDDEAIISVAVTDAPVDFATDVVVEITGVELVLESGNTVVFDLDPVSSIDLLELSGGETAILLDDERIPGGRYTAI